MQSFDYTQDKNAKLWYGSAKQNRYLMRTIVHNLSKPPQKINDYLSETRKSYDDPQIVREYWERKKDFINLRDLERMVAYLGRSGKVLDLGCGPGRDSRYLGSCGLFVIGIDYASSMISFARRQHSSLKNVKFYKMDMHKLDFPDESFDGVWASASLLHIPKKELLAVLREIHRVIRKKGILYVHVKKGRGERMLLDTGKYSKPVKRLFTFFTKRELERFLVDSGFTPISFDHSFFSDARTEWIDVFCRKE